MSSEPPPYQIHIPGMADVFRFGASPVYDKELKYQRFKRMKDSNSPVPEPLKWIPQVINQIDDAQDILYTAAYAGKFLLRKVAPRFIPFVGWGLLAMDVANLVTSILGVAMSPGVSKVNLMRTARSMRGGMKAGTAAFNRFVGKDGLMGKIGFALQAAQASETITGYGLSLGAIMGGVSDTIWGGIRALQGARVEIKGPPPADPAAKAARYLTQSYRNTALGKVLSGEDQKILLAAHNIAVGEIHNPEPPASDALINQMEHTRTALYEPWEPSTVAMLRDQGITETSPMRDYTTSDDTTLTYGAAMLTSMTQQAESGLDLRANFGDGQDATILHQIYTEAGRDSINFIAGTTDEAWAGYEKDVIIASRVSDYPWKPAQPLTDAKKYQWFTRAKQRAAAIGWPYPDERLWVAAAKDLGITLAFKY